jgi:hypothetical protein
VRVAPWGADFVEGGCNDRCSYQEAATGEASLTGGDGQRRRSGLDYGPEPGDDHADAPADGDGRGTGTEMADTTDTMLDKLREAAAAHDTSELNGITTLS